jgi:glycosyltransferase involved in cell wall biosynthesis
MIFVVPDPASAAPISGGNLYNLRLLAALREAGADPQVVDRTGAEAAVRARAASVFVDSLYLDDLPHLRRLAPASSHVFLVAHYLPTLVARGEPPQLAELSSAEREALAAADGFVAPSEFMAAVLGALGAPPRPVGVVAPGMDPALALARTRRQQAEPQHSVPRTPLEAIVVANLVPGKGLQRLFAALAPHLAAGAPLRLTVIGSATMDVEYAAACRACVAGDPALARAVRFVGTLSHAETLARVAQSDLFVSASRMESFGLALAEARALGVPIVARDGGNVAVHVSPEAGGVLCADDAALAAVCARLAREPAELARAAAAAGAARGPVRTWAEAARDVLLLSRLATRTPATA